MRFISYLKYKIYKRLKARRLLRSKARAYPFKTTKRFWLRPHLQKNARHTLGDYFKLIVPSKTSDVELFYKMMRMSPQAFNKLTNMLGPFIERKFLIREPISVEERVALTIR